MWRWLGLSLVLMAGSLALAQERRAGSKKVEVADRGPDIFTLEPFGRTQRSVVCTAGQESRAVAIGDGRTSLAIYAYDPRGHCVAYDDEPSGFYDDRIVAWVPTVTGLFDVQYRNMGSRANRVEVAAK